MKLNSKNLYIQEHGGEYSVHIEMPDGSRNYLHNSPTDIEHAIMIMHDFDGDVELGYHNTKIVSNGTYYRINVILYDGRDEEQIFHSRQLNLQDVIYEYSLLVIPND